MQPQLGWVWLSQAERRAAEQALSDAGPDGTRDELGFGVIHFAYADRFFPGTSGQHTSLRYVWFICWTYLELAQRHPGGEFPLAALHEIENRTGHKLMARYGQGDGTGIIGGRVLRAGRSPVTKPSGIYWSAMRNWGLIAPLARTSTSPTQGELHWRWDDLTSRRPRPEIDAEVMPPLFVDAPTAPAGWRGCGTELGFELDSASDEAGRIRRAWARQRDPLGRVTLLSRLGERRAPAPTSLTSRTVLSLCTPDEVTSLRRARRAGALAGVGRALHTAMVQRLKSNDRATAQQTRAWLNGAVDAHGADALALDLNGLRVDVPTLGSLATLIEATQDWLKAGAGDLARLEPLYRVREMQQKPGRALLARDAVGRRDAWHPREQGPLTYRWERVAAFLTELATA